MDLRSYYRLIREETAKLDEGDQVVVSLPTKDGGREGVVSEVPREIAAKLIVEQRARLASKEEREGHFAKQATEREEYERSLELRRVQVQVMSGMDQAQSSRRQGRK